MLAEALPMGCERMRCERMGHAGETTAAANSAGRLAASRAPLGPPVCDWSVLGDAFVCMYSASVRFSTAGVRRLSVQILVKRRHTGVEVRAGRGGTSWLRSHASKPAEWDIS